MKKQWVFSGTQMPEIGQEIKAMFANGAVSTGIWDGNTPSIILSYWQPID